MVEPHVPVPADFGPFFRDVHIDQLELARHHPSVVTEHRDFIR